MPYLRSPEATHVLALTAIAEDKRKAKLNKLIDHAEEIINMATHKKKKKRPR